MQITIASDSDQKLWDDVVHSSEEGTLFHTWKWLRVLEKHSVKKIFSRQYKGILYPLIVWEGKEIIGLMPVYFFNSNFFKITISPPYSVEYHTLGPIMNKPGIPIKPHRKYHNFFEFQNTLDNFLKNELKSNYISIDTSPGISDPRPYLWNGYQVKPQFTYLTDLKLGEKKLWENVNRTVRNEVNKATKNGITVEKGSKSDIELLFKLLDVRNRIHTGETFLPDIFENFYPDNLNFFIAKKDGVPLTGALNIVYKNKISGWVGLPKVSVDNINPNYLLVWECICWACQNNFELFENISANELSTFPFKNKFNPEIIPCYRVRWYSPVPHFIRSIYQGITHETY